MNKFSTNPKKFIQRRFLELFRGLILGTLFWGLVSIPVHARSGGRLDKNFGTDGIVFTGANHPAYVALQGDNKILLAGGSTLERYNTDGSLDTTFGTVGTVDISFGSATAVALLANGKIIVAVDTSAIAQGVGSDFALVAYSSDGSLDTGFGNNGFVATSVGFDSSVVHDLAVQADGKIVTAGKTYELFYDGFGFSIKALTFALARYNSDGSLDTGFGSNGTVITDIAAGAPEEASTVSLQADGKIVAAGYALVAGTALDFALARYNIDGTLDSTFGSNGIVTTHLNSGAKARDIAVQADGKIAVAGFTTSSGTGSDFALVRYNTDGSLDTAFGNNGRVITDFDNDNDYAHAIGIQSDGKIVVAGNVSILVYPQQFRRFAAGLVRYNTNGQPDPTFGNSGQVVTQVGESTTYASDLAIQPDGKILVAGTALLRYLD